MRGLWERILSAIVRTRFIPLEVVIALSSMAHGLWLIFPFWSFALPDTVTGMPHTYEMLFGGSWAMLGIALLVSLMRKANRRVRKTLSMCQFIFWFFATMLAFMASGVGLQWISLITITIAAALAYLNVSVGEAE